MTSIRPLRRTPLLVIAVAALVAACGAKTDNAPAAAGGKSPGAGGGPPPAEVGVVTVNLQPVGLVTELPGRLEASRVAQVRARVPGILLKRVFVEGSDVKAGQLLFQIDSAPLQSQVAAVQAQIARAQANVTQATAQAERYKPLVEANAISKQDYINAVAAQKTAEADVAASRASLRSAQINLGYASVTAPISGRIGRALVTEGALVGQGEATPLALVQQINPMYVNFTQSTTELLNLRRAVESGRFKAAGGADAASVGIVLEDGSVYPQPGKLLFSDLSVDPTSGQITLRAEVPNPKGLLLPGHVRSGSPRAGADADRHRRAAAGGAARLDRRQRHGGRRRGQGHAEAGEGRHRAGRQLGHPRRRQDRRDGDGRRLPEAARRRAGEAGAVATRGREQRARRRRRLRTASAPR